MSDMLHLIETFERIIRNSKEPIYLERYENDWIRIGRGNTWSGGADIYEAIDNWIVTASSAYGEDSSLKKRLPPKEQLEFE